MANAKLVSNLTNYWANLSPKDRLALQVLGVFFSVLVLVYAVMVPAHKYANNASDYYQTQVALQEWVEQNASRVVVGELADPEAGIDTEITGESLLTIASGTAKDYQITFKRFEPNGDGELRIWLEKVPFNQVIAWLAKLNQNYNVRVTQANLDRRDVSGLVNARVLLSN